jgi:aryl carrier-like protein
MMAGFLRQHIDAFDLVPVAWILYISRTFTGTHQYDELSLLHIKVMTFHEFKRSNELTKKGTTPRTVHSSVLETPQAKHTADQAANACAAPLPPTTRPSLWLCLDSMPKTPHGKFDQRTLNILIHDYTLATITKKAAVSGLSTARSEAENRVAEMISNVLALPQESVDLDASFIELGGTSIQAMRVAASLQEFGINVDILNSNLWPVYSACRYSFGRKEQKFQYFTLLHI